MISIERAEPFHAALIVNNMRQVSLDEVEAAGVDAKKTIEQAIMRSDYCWIGAVDGEVVCLWGIETQSIASGSAYLWLLTTPKVEDHTFLFVRRSQQFIKATRTRYKRIHGFVDVDFARSIAWLRWLGFTVGKPDGRLRPFWMEGY